MQISYFESGVLFELNLFYLHCFVGFDNFQTDCWNERIMTRKIQTSGRSTHTENITTWKFPNRLILTWRASVWEFNLSVLLTAHVLVESSVFGGHLATDWPKYLAVTKFWLPEFRGFVVFLGHKYKSFDAFSQAFIQVSVRSTRTLILDLIRWVTTR